MLVSARDRRDGERAAHILPDGWKDPNVEEDLDSEIRECLRQQVGDVGHTSAMMHVASGTQVRPLRLDLQNTEEAQSEE